MMARFGKARAASSSPVPILTIDKTCGDPTARAALAAKGQGNLVGVRDVVGSISDQATFEFVVSLLCDDSHDIPLWLSQWLEQEPDDLTARTAHGIALVRAAWSVRTSKR